MTAMATPSFLSEFPPVTTEAWEQVIREDLKGAAYAEKLVWRSPEGINVKPYYRAEDLAGIEFSNAAPGDFPYVRGTRSTGGWRIREEIDAIDPEDANRAARFAVAAGAEEIAFSRIAVANASDLGILLSDLGEVAVHIEAATDATVCFLIDRLNNRPGTPNLSGGLDWSADPDASASVLAKAPSSFATFTIHADRFQESGVTAVEEVGFALASGVDFLREMQQRGLAPDRAASSITFSFAMGPEFFMQAAKLRAFRLVWSQAAESFGIARERARVPDATHAHRDGIGLSPILTPMRCGALPKPCPPSLGAPTPSMLRRSMSAAGRRTKPAAAWRAIRRSYSSRRLSWRASRTPAAVRITWRH